MRDKDKRFLIIVAVVLGLAVFGGMIDSDSNGGVQPTPTPTATAESKPTSEPSQEYDKFNLDTVCAEEAIIKGYKAASFTYALDHPVSADKVGLYDKNGKEILLVRGPIATRDKVDTQYTCYITTEEGAKPTVLEVDGKALDGSYSDDLYDESGKSLREKYGEN